MIRPVAQSVWCRRQEPLVCSVWVCACGPSTVRGGVYDCLPGSSASRRDAQLARGHFVPEPADITSKNGRSRRTAQAPRPRPPLAVELAGAPARVPEEEAQLWALRVRQRAADEGRGAQEVDAWQHLGACR